MGRLTDFIRRERLYILLFILVVLMSLLMTMPGEVKVKSAKGDGALNIAKIEADKAKALQEELLKRAAIEEKVQKNSLLALIFSLAALLVVAVISLGFLLDIVLVFSGIGGKTVIAPTHKVIDSRWGVIDVAKVAILFLFFGYMTVITESLLIHKAFPVLKNENLRMILNSTILDVLVVVFIIYFAVRQHKEKLSALGISLKNFTRNVFYGVAGYIALVPILVMTLAVIAFIIKITNYTPEKQPVVELFLKEENMSFLLYSSIFASVIGPFIEELFFRAFMYGALRRYIGIFWAMIFTSAVFAALHTNVVGFVPIMMLGMLLAYLYEKTGTLVSSITVHVIHNLSMVFFVFLIKQVA